MNEKAVYLQGLDDNTGRTECILLGDEFEAALKALFKAVYGKAMGGGELVCWCPGERRSRRVEGNAATRF